MACVVCFGLSGTRTIVAMVVALGGTNEVLHSSAKTDLIVDWPEGHHMYKYEVPVALALLCFYLPSAL